MPKCNLTSDSDDESGASVTTTYDDNVSYNDTECLVCLNYFSGDKLENNGSDAIVAFLGLTKYV